MKTCKKLLALLLVLAMIFAFAACDNSKDDDKDDKGSSNVQETNPPETDPPTEPDPTDPEICGKWETSLDMSGAFNEMMAGSVGEDLEMPEVPINMILGFEFSEDGEFLMTMSLDEDSVDEYMEQLVDAMVDYTVAMVEAQGATQADLEAEMGMTMEEYGEFMKETLADSAAVGFETEELEYYYIVEENKLYIAEHKDDLEDMEEYTEFTLEDGVLEITKIQGDAEEFLEMIEMYGMELPWTFEKV